MKIKITKVLVLCTFTVILSSLFIFVTSHLISFNFKSILMSAISLAFILNVSLLIKWFTNSEHNVLSEENFNKKLIEYNELLAQIIKVSKIRACVEDSNGNRVFCSELLKKFDTATDFKDNTEIKIDNNIYKISKRNIKLNPPFGEFNVTILENITEQILLHKNKEESFAMIAHDLKTPILAISHVLDLICKGQFGELSPTQSEVLKLCYTSAGFAKYLVGNILCSYKINNNEIHLQPELFDISKIIEDCNNEISFLLSEKALNINLNIPANLMVTCDKNELQRVILNLLYNAVTYSKPNSDIDVNLNFDETYLNFSITNQSEYISGKDIKAIFNKDFSLNNKYNKPGTGLGLYVSNKIIQAHGGEMIAKSSTNNINIFGFKLKHNNSIQLEQQSR